MRGNHEFLDRLGIAARAKEFGRVGDSRIGPEPIVPRVLVQGALDKVDRMISRIEPARDERRLNDQQPSINAPTKDWRRVADISEDKEFTRLMLAEIEAAHEADRQAALAEPAP